MYFLLKKILFTLDPETAHHLTKKFSAFIPSLLFPKPITSRVLETKIGNTKIKNPIGLAAGFDKNADMISFAKKLGFGFSEIGSVSALPCPGHPQPRLFRLKEDHSLINGMGLPNLGAKKLVAKLQKNKSNLPYGINLVKTPDFACPPNKKIKGIDDFIQSYLKLNSFGAYLVFNLSCPNTEDNQTFEDAKLFSELAAEIQTIKTERAINKPHYLKISPDLPFDKLKHLVDAALKYNFDGFVVGNTTRQRPALISKINPELESRGGLSGSALTEIANQQLKTVFDIVGKIKTIIGVGGIMSFSDLKTKLALGASLFQVYTGLIYNGPRFINELNKKLIHHCEKSGVSSYLDLVGKKFN